MVSSYALFYTPPLRFMYSLSFLIGPKKNGTFLYIVTIYIKTSHFQCEMPTDYFGQEVSKVFLSFVTVIAQSKHLHMNWKE